MACNSPDYLEVYGHFRLYVGPRYIGAGLRLDFCHDQPPGIHFKVQPLEEECRDLIVRGLQEGMALRFPEYLSTGSIHVTEITEHPADSSQMAFYCAARMAIDQAFSICETRRAHRHDPQKANSPIGGQEDHGGV